MKLYITGFSRPSLGDNTGDHLHNDEHIQSTYSIQKSKEQNITVLYNEKLSRFVVSSLYLVANDI